MTRETLITAFLNGTDWADARRTPLAGDASNRRYERLIDDASHQSAVLMDAPPSKGEDTRPFVEIARFLKGAGLRAPQILAWDEHNGFILLEDLGDDLFARVLQAHPDEEERLYRAAVDVLLHLHSASAPPDLLPYDPETMAPLGCLALDWYAQGANHQIDDATRLSFETTLATALNASATAPAVLVQRDYHAENLLWLPNENGVSRVGLLDFQDARLGQPTYDLVSLLEDARRDVSPEVQRAMKAYYLDKTDLTEHAFEASYAAQGAQRNLRILGVFARLSLHFSKPQYIDLIPRVWSHLQTDLAHPSLSNLRDICASALPAPTQPVLEELKRKCGTVPHL